jgi:hypothetical protein
MRGHRIIAVVNALSPRCCCRAATRRPLRGAKPICALLTEGYTLRQIARELSFRSASAIGCGRVAAKLTGVCHSGLSASKVLPELLPRPEIRIGHGRANP